MRYGILYALFTKLAKPTLIVKHGQTSRATGGWNTICEMYFYPNELSDVYYLFCMVSTSIRFYIWLLLPEAGYQ